MQGRTVLKVQDNPMMFSLQRPKLKRLVVELPWMLEELSYDNADGFYLLSEIVLQFPPGDSSLAQTIAGLEWVADGIDSDELRFLIDLQDIQGDPLVFDSLVSLPTHI